MGSSKPAAEFDIIDAGNCPEFFATHTRMEPAGGGNIRVYVYNLRRGTELHLVYTVVVPAASLAVMARQASMASADAHNIEMFEGEFRH